MTIPPVGPVPGSQAQPEDKANENERPDARRVERTEPQGDSARSERVEFSPEAERIRQQQADITRLQIAERAAQAILDDMREIRELAARRAQAESENAAEIEQRVSERAESARSRADEARFEDENLLDGREMQFQVGDREETVRTPDASRLIETYIREAREAVRERREVRDSESNERLRRFIEEARDARRNQEEDVRRSVEGAMRESSSSRPRDVRDAEQMIRRAGRARNNYGNSQRPPGHDQISGKAVNLLQ